MCAEKRQHTARAVGQNYVSLGVKLHNEVVRGLARAKRKVHDAVHAQLPNRLQTLRATVTTQLHGENRGHLHTTGEQRNEQLRNSLTLSWSVRQKKN